MPRPAGTQAVKKSERHRWSYLWRSPDILTREEPAMMFLCLTPGSLNIVSSLLSTDPALRTREDVQEASDAIWNDTSSGTQNAKEVLCAWAADHLQKTAPTTSTMPAKAVREKFTSYLAKVRETHFWTLAVQRRLVRQGFQNSSTTTSSSTSSSLLASPSQLAPVFASVRRQPIEVEQAVADPSQPVLPLPPKSPNRAHRDNKADNAVQNAKSTKDKIGFISPFLSSTVPLLPFDDTLVEADIRAVIKTRIALVLTAKHGFDEAEADTVAEAFTALFKTYRILKIVYSLPYLTRAPLTLVGPLVSELSGALGSHAFDLEAQTSGIYWKAVSIRMNDQFQNAISGSKNAITKSRSRARYNYAQNEDAKDVARQALELLELETDCLDFSKTAVFHVGQFGSGGRSRQVNEQSEVGDADSTTARDWIFSRQYAEARNATAHWILLAGPNLLHGPTALDRARKRDLYEACFGAVFEGPNNTMVKAAGELPHIEGSTRLLLTRQTTVLSKMMPNDGSKDLLQDAAECLAIGFISKGVTHAADSTPRDSQFGLTLSLIEEKVFGKPSDLVFFNLHAGNLEPGQRYDELTPPPSSRFQEIFSHTIRPILVAPTSPQIFRSMCSEAQLILPQGSEMTRLQAFKTGGLVVITKEGLLMASVGGYFDHHDAVNLPTKGTYRSIARWYFHSILTAAAVARKFDPAATKQHDATHLHDFLARWSASSLSKEVFADALLSTAARRLAKSGGLEQVFAGGWVVSPAAARVLSVKKIDWANARLIDIVGSWSSRTEGSTEGDESVFIGPSLEFDLLVYHSRDVSHQRPVFNFRPWFFAVDSDQKTIDVCPAKEGELHAETAYAAKMQRLSSMVVDGSEGSTFKNAKVGSIKRVVIENHPWETGYLAIRSTIDLPSKKPDWLRTGGDSGNKIGLTVAKLDQSWSKECKAWLSQMLQRNKDAEYDETMTE